MARSLKKANCSAGETVGETVAEYTELVRLTTP